MEFIFLILVAIGWIFLIKSFRKEQDEISKLRLLEADYYNCIINFVNHVDYVRFHDVCEKYIEETEDKNERS